jgi:hypothetical protein
MFQLRKPLLRLCFARSGCDVSVQYGANQPEYDLMVARGKLLRVSVKGSQDGSWGLCQSQSKKGSAHYHDAIDRWLERHKPRTVICLVHFRSVDAVEMPRVCLATPKEIAERLHATAKRRGGALNGDQRHLVLERLRKYQQLGCFR